MGNNLNHPLSLELRERKNIPEGCQHCDFLVECGGGCPLARAHQSVHPITADIFSGGTMIDFIKRLFSKEPAHLPLNPASTPTTAPRMTPNPTACT